MPTTDTGIYELVLEQTYQSQAIINVFHYLHSLGDDDEQALCAQAFDEDQMASVVQLVNTGVVFDNIRVANLTGLLADANLVPSPSVGVVTGAAVASFVSASMRYNRTTKDTRNGSKRWSGMVEENLLNQGFAPAYFTTLQTIANQLAVQISTVGAIFNPIILRKPPDGSGFYTYNVLANITALDRATTQNSRKSF